MAQTTSGLVVVKGEDLVCTDNALDSGHTLLIVDPVHHVQVTGNVSVVGLGNIVEIVGREVPRSHACGQFLLLQVFHHACVIGMVGWDNNFISVNQHNIFVPRKQHHDKTYAM